MHTSDHLSKQSELLLSYKHVRQAVGALGFLLPVSLLVLAALPNVTFAPSISEFYHTPAREVLVAIIGAISVFLLSYKGYAIDPTRAQDSWAERVFSDRRVAIAAAIGALGVAFFPTGIDQMSTLTPTLCNDDGTSCVVDMSKAMAPTALTLLIFDQQIVTKVHGLSALVFFVALSIFCLSNFRRGPQKAEHGIYYGCGIVLVLCTIALVVMFLTKDLPSLGGWGDTIENHRLVFWVETIGLFAFSISWLVKGENLITQKAFAITGALPSKS